MKEENIIAISILILFFLTLGEPDILDGLIKIVNKNCNN